MIKTPDSGLPPDVTVPLRVYRLGADETLLLCVELLTELTELDEAVLTATKFRVTLPPTIPLATLGVNV